MPGTTLHELASLIYTTTLRSRNYYCTHFTVIESEGQKGLSNLPKVTNDGVSM